MTMSLSLNGLALSVLFLPCFFLLVIVSETLTRLATRALQMHARSHFDWPQGSLFTRPRPPLYHHHPHYCKLRHDRHHHHQLCVTRYLQCGDGAVQCVFCLNEMTDGEEMRELRCRHIFHRACLDEWLEHRWATCPVCRDVIAGAAAAEEEAAEDEEEDEEEEMGLALISSYYRQNWWMW